MKKEENPNAKQIFILAISGFAGNEKQAELQIGYPTDVRHVAHIGWDGPSVTPPSWVRCYFSILPPIQSYKTVSKIIVGVNGFPDE